MFVHVSMSVDVNMSVHVSMFVDVSMSVCTNVCE